MINFNNLTSEDLRNIVKIIDFIKEHGMGNSSIPFKISKEPEDNENECITKEEKILEKMKNFEDIAWDDDWEKVIEARKNNPNRKYETPTEEDLERILKKLKGEE